MKRRSFKNSADMASTAALVSIKTYLQLELSKKKLPQNRFLLKSGYYRALFFAFQFD